MNKRNASAYVQWAVAWAIRWYFIFIILFKILYFKNKHIYFYF